MYRFITRKCQEKNERRVEKWSTIFSLGVGHRLANEEILLDGPNAIRQSMMTNTAWCFMIRVSALARRFLFLRFENRLQWF
jgi:hypothetical protein